MRHSNRLLGLALLGLFLFQAKSFALEIMPFHSLKPGMVGEGRTVFQGEKVETFSLKIIDVLEDMGPSGGGLILFRGLSENLRQHQGVSQGMSGSPIYINGKLIGAVSLAFPYGDPMVGGATPIEEMLAVLSESDNLQPVSMGYVIPGYGKAVVATAPVFVTGASPRAMEDLQSRLFKDQGGVQVMPAGLGASGGEEAEQILSKGPEPGSVLTVNMLLGDVTVFSAGTVTAVVGDKVVAFGHSFRRVGPVDLVMGKGYVSHIMASKEVPYKVVRPIGLYGRMDQDRGVAMTGTVGKWPKLTRIKIHVHDASRNKTTDANFRAVRDRKASLEVLRTAIFSTMDKALDRIGEGTSKVSFSVTIQGRKKPLERVNTWYNPVDIAAESVRELDLLLRFFLQNEFEDVDVQDLALSVDISDAQNAMTVKRVALVEEKANKKGVAKGEKTDDKGIVIHKHVGPPASGKSGHKVDPKSKKKIAENDEEEGDDEEEPDRSPPGEAKTGQTVKEPSLVIHPGESFKVKVTLLPYRHKPVTRMLKVKMDRKKFPPGEYSFTIGGQESSGDSDDNQKEPPLSLDEALKEFHKLNKNDELILECRNIGGLPPGHKEEKGPDKDALKQILKIDGYSVSGKRNFRVTVKKKDTLKRSLKFPKKAGSKKIKPLPKSGKGGKAIKRKSRLDASRDYSPSRGGPF